MRSFRTADACKALKAIADENDLSKTTLQHIKGVLGGIFTHAKNEGAFDGANPVQEARIPSNAREPAETYAYKLTEICSILELRGWNGMAGTAFAVASRRICMNWGRTRRSFNASYVMRNRTSPKIAPQGIRSGSACRDEEVRSELGCCEPKCTESAPNKLGQLW